jgi:carboxyl-terminal processing protease
MNRHIRRTLIITILFLASGALIGGRFGGRVLANQGVSGEQADAFGLILATVEERYVGETDSKELVEEAISGLLRTLDPHSNYLNAESFREMRDEQRGRFYGLGIQITKRGTDVPLTIISPIDNTPAYRAGLLAGDVISEIEGQATIEMTVQDAVRLLKGERGTEVTITIKRPGLEEPFQVTIERDEIPIESLRLAFMIEPGIGFIRITSFTSTTADELDRALADLNDQGMDRLILDLRGNPGGLLDQAVRVSERLLPPDKLIVYTQGRAEERETYRSRQGVAFTEVPLILLVDHSSASASEIVSGAVQDHDRGLVVGETTFGKGLVQRVMQLNNGGGALAVTTAKYYTPSGRLIQRDYSDLEEYYFDRGDDKQLAARDDEDAGDVAEEDEGELFYTDAGRKVTGGGGIRPDYFVKAPEGSALLAKLLRENLIFNFSVEYAKQHADLEPGFRDDEPRLAEFREFLIKMEVDYDAAEFEERSADIALRLRSQISRVLWDQIEEARVLAEADTQIQRALELFPEAAKLANIELPGADHLRAQAETTAP